MTVRSGCGCAVADAAQTTIAEAMRTSLHDARHKAFEEAASLLEVRPDAIRLACGEMTAREMRTVQAVLRWRAGAIRRLADA